MRPSCKIIIRKHAHIQTKLGLTRRFSLTVCLYQEGGGCLVDSSGVLWFPLYTAWLELNLKEVTFGL